MPHEQLPNIYALDEQFSQIIECELSDFEPKVQKLTALLPELTFEGWSNVPMDYKSRQDWQTNGRSIAAKEKPLARVRSTWIRKSESMGIDIDVEKFHNLFHESQTRPTRQTELSRARGKFFKFFAEPADWKRLIRWTQGEWHYPDDCERYWDDTVDRWGWRMFIEKITLPKLIEHELGREIYGVYGGKSSYHLTIDLDLHNQPLDLFKTRLDLLLDRFHGQHGCHFQVSNANAGGVHLILFFGNAGLLATRRKWLLNVLVELDQADPRGKFTKPTSDGPKFNIEVYPDPQKPIRLPLARGRTMLLERPLEPVIRRGKACQDVVGYVDWLTTKPADRKSMAKDDVIRFIMDRLDLLKSKDNQPPQQKEKPFDQPRKKLSPSVQAQVSEKVSLKGVTKAAIIDYWLEGKPAFQHLNSAILTTLQALYAQNISEQEAVAVLNRYCNELPNKEQLSTRLVGSFPLVQKEIARQANKIWQTEVNAKWKQSAQKWASYGFLVFDKSTWQRKSQSKLDEVIVDCEELVLTNAERELVIKYIAPLVLGPKQANKPDKQNEVIRAVIYFLRYVKCCPREIPYKAVSSILSKFAINMSQDHKKSKFLAKLVELNWIYIKADYHCPVIHGLERKGRARAYGIGPQMAGKFNASKQEKTSNNNRDLYTALHFFENKQNQHQKEIVPICWRNQDRYLETILADSEDAWATSTNHKAGEAAFPLPTF